MTLRHRDRDLVDTTRPLHDALQRDLAVHDCDVYLARISRILIAAAIAVHEARTAWPRSRAR